MNIALLEDWIDDVGLPPGVKTHFAPARELVLWLQVSSAYVNREDRPCSTLM